MHQIYNMQPQQVTPQKEAQDWNDFDINGDGYIDLKEMKQYLRGIRASDHDAQVIFSKLDLDGNGGVDAREFRTPVDTELFDFLDRSHNQETVQEIELTEDMYLKLFGNPMANMRNLPPSEYNIAGQKIEPP